MAYIGKNPDFNTGTLNPQSVEPANPVEGMLYYDDGTNRTEGLYVYSNSNWVAAASLINKTQIKTLSSDTFANGTIASLTFNNLVVGRVYKVDLQAFIRSAAVGVKNSVQIVHNSIIRAEATAAVDVDASPKTIDSSTTASVSFEAEATTVTFNYVSGGGASVVRGNGTRSETFAQITELNNTVETTDFT